MLIHPDRWKSLRGRYQEDRPHRMLSLDGGASGVSSLWGFLRVSRSSYRRRPDRNLKNTSTTLRGPVRGR
jgi:hypothetical protein